MKLSENGDILWQSDDEYLLPNSIVPSSDSNYVFGYYQQWPGFYPALAKINDDGDSLWTQILPIESNNLITDIQNINNGYTVVGHNYDSSFIIKTNPAGMTEWVNFYDSIRLSSICVNEDNGFVGVGYSGISWESETIVIKTDSLGGLVWKNSYEFGESSKGYSVCIANDGNFVIAISWGSSVTLIKIDNSGEIIWEKEYGSGLRDIKPTCDNGFIGAGTNLQSYIVKTDQDGLITSLNEIDINNNIFIELYPNPTSEITTINYELISEQNVTLSVQNIAGQELKIFQLGNKKNGFYTLDCTVYKPGIYFITLKSDLGLLTKKLIIE